MELVGTLSNLRDELITREDTLKLKQEIGELKSKIKEENKAFVKEVASIVDNLCSAIKNGRANNERIRQENEEKEQQIKKEIEEQQKKGLKAIALLEEALKKFETEETEILEGEQELENLTQQLDEFFAEDVKSDIVDLDKVDIRIDPDFIDKLLANAQSEVERDFIFSKADLLIKEEKKRISDEKERNRPGNHIVDALNIMTRLFLKSTELRAEIFENLKSLTLEEVYNDIKDVITEELLAIIRDAPSMIISGLINLDGELIVKGLLHFVVILRRVKHIVKMIKQLDKVAKKILAAEEKFREITEKFEEAQEIAEKLQSGDFLELVQDISLEKKGKNKRKNDNDNKKDNNKKNEEVKPSEKKFDKPEHKELAKDMLKKGTKQLEDKMKTLADFAREKVKTQKQKLAQLLSSKKKAKHELEKAKTTIGCFSGETLVHTTTGLQPIKNIKRGDEVYATETNTKTFTAKKNLVVNVSRNIVFTLLILFFGNTSIETTPEHPFWIVGQGWTEAKNICAGDLVQTINNEKITIERIEKRRGQFEVYNLDVADCDTFFVHKKGILVHNADKPCPGESRPPEKGNLKKENKIPIIFTENPKNINFSQRTINIRFDTPLGKKSIQKVIKDGPEQVENFPPIKVIKVKGQLVVRDGNSRLYVAVETKAKEIRYILETSHNSMLDLTKRLRSNGLGNTGTSRPPRPK